jgi:hypothetical protein
MGRIAITAVVRPEGFMLGATEVGLGGYVLMAHFGVWTTYKAAQKVADERNVQAGLTPEEAIKIVLGSLVHGGWRKY